MTTAAEQQILDDIAQATARGEDPFGDNENAAVAETVAEEVAAEEAAEAAAKPESEASTEVVDESVLNEIANEEAPLGADPLQFNVQVPSDYKTARDALLAEKATAMEQMMGGEIDPKAYAAIEARVMDGLEELSSQRIRAETLLEANAQTAASAQGAAIQALIVRAKDEVPYATDAKAQKQFDMALKLQMDDSDNAGKPFAHAVNEAHKVVLALRGVQAIATKPTPEPRKPTGDAPVTLRGIPAAATSNTGGSITDQLARLSGQEYEAAYAKLTPTQRAAMLED